MMWLVDQTWHVLGGVAAALALSLVASALVYLLFLSISQAVGRGLNVMLGRPAAAAGERWAPESVERWLRKLVTVPGAQSPSPSES
jgi:hypothetical protein